MRECADGEMHNLSRLDLPNQILIHASFGTRIFYDVQLNTQQIALQNIVLDCYDIVKNCDFNTSK